MKRDYTGVDIGGYIAPPPQQPLAGGDVIRGLGHLRCVRRLIGEEQARS
jgi:hypothetical protein